MGGLTPLTLIAIVIGGLLAITLLVVLVTVVAKKTSKTIDRKDQ